MKVDVHRDVVEMSNKAKRTKKEYEEIDQMAEESIRLYLFLFSFSFSSSSSSFYSF